MRRVCRLQPVVSGPIPDNPPAGFSRHLRCHRLQPVVFGPTPHNPPAGFSRRVAAMVWHPMRSIELDYDYELRARATITRKW
ncbi:MAG: hypothetical protein ACYC4U_33800, partial [Pirellulaceae bacterium]